MSKNSYLVKRALEAFDAADEVAAVRVQQEQLKITLRLIIVDSHNQQKAGTPAAVCHVIVPIRGESTKMFEMQPSYTDGGKIEFAKNHVDDLRAELYVALYDFDEPDTHMFPQTKKEIITNEKGYATKIQFQFKDTTTREEVTGSPHSFSVSVRTVPNGKCEFENVKFQFDSSHHPHLVNLCEKEACRALARQALGVTKRLVVMDK